MSTTTYEKSYSVPLEIFYLWVFEPPKILFHSHLPKHHPTIIMPHKIFYRTFYSYFSLAIQITKFLKVGLLFQNIFYMGLLIFYFYIELFVQVFPGWKKRGSEEGGTLLSESSNFTLINYKQENKGVKNKNYLTTFLEAEVFSLFISIHNWYFILFFTAVNRT